MNTITIDTISYHDCTIGRLWCNGFQCFTLELPWVDNRNKISCIPSGQYRYKFRESPANGDVLELQDVPGRTFIQIHSANYIRQLLGCIAVGDSVRFLDSDSIPDVTNSKATLRKLLEVAGKEGIVAINGERRS